MVRIAKIKWTKIAKRQLLEILSFFNKRNHSITYGDKLYLLIRWRLEQIHADCLLGEETGQGVSRKVSVSHYSIYYRIETNKVVVLSIWDARRDPEIEPF